MIKTALFLTVCMTAGSTVFAIRPDAPRVDEHPELVNTPVRSTNAQRQVAVTERLSEQQRRVTTVQQPTNSRVPRAPQAAELLPAGSLLPESDSDDEKQVSE